MLRIIAFLRPRGREWRGSARITGSLTRRMIGMAALWIMLLLAGGDVALDRVLTGAITRNFLARTGIWCRQANDVSGKPCSSTTGAPSPASR